MFIVGRKEYKTIVEVSGIYHTSHPGEDAILRSIVSRFGGKETDYTVLILDDRKSDSKRISIGDDFDAIWLDGEISGVSFEREDIKPIIEFSCDKDYILDNGADYATVFAVIKKSDGSIDNNFNKRILIPVEIKGTYGYKQVLFQNGVAEYKFTGSSMGKIKIPSKRRLEGFKITDQIAIDIVMS